MHANKEYVRAELEQEEDMERSMFVWEDVVEVETEQQEVEDATLFTPLQHQLRMLKVNLPPHYVNNEDGHQEHSSLDASVSPKDMLRLVILARYPFAKTVNASENVHGTIIPDPYRWLEDPFDPEVLKFMEEQDSLSQGIVQGLPGYKKFMLSFLRVNSFDRFSSPIRKGDYWYYTANFGGLLNQNVLYRTKDLESQYPEEFLNPNNLSPNGVDQVDGWTFSPDGSLFAFVATKNETDYGWIGFRNVSNGQPFDTVLRYSVRYLGDLTFEWRDDGVVYTHYDNPKLEWTTAGRNNDPFPMKMRRSFHRFGTSDAEDVDCGPIIIDPSKPLPVPPVCKKGWKDLVLRRSEGDDVVYVKEEDLATMDGDVWDCEEVVEVVDAERVQVVPGYMRMREAVLDLKDFSEGKRLKLRPAGSFEDEFFRYPVDVAEVAPGRDMDLVDYESVVMGVDPVRWMEEGVFVGRLQLGNGEGVKERFVSVYKTAFGAERFRLVGVLEDEGNGGDMNAFEILPEHEEYTLDEVHVVGKEKGGFVFVTYIADVTHVVRIYSNFTSETGSGKLHQELDLHGGACSNVIVSKSPHPETPDAPESEWEWMVSFKYDSLIDPGAVYLYWPGEKKLDVWRKMKFDFFPAVEGLEWSEGVWRGMRVEQIFFSSRDGTKVPMWTVRGRDVGKGHHGEEGGGKNEGESGLVGRFGVKEETDECEGVGAKEALHHEASTVWLTGYGGFLVARMPTFSSFIVALLAASPSSTYVLVNARGGKEYGMRWYEGGRNLNKVHVFEDFVWAARHLVAKGWTKPGRIGVQGASNGGLMASAVSLMAPELFGAAVVDVGVHDIYGRFDNATEALARLSWSPVETVRRMIPGGFRFTPTLISTGDHDTRVSPLHSLKLAAEMQRVSGGGEGGGHGDKSGSVALLRIRELSGHNIFSIDRQAKAWSEKVAFWAHMVQAHGLA
ncbi:hypothetical protein HDU97_002098 [Phlyctochytrium planicorne]|nr:hypothetical protein HDU97_002098 [Phlyctochytrium planicorne]